MVKCEICFDVLNECRSHIWDCKTALETLERLFPERYHHELIHVCLIWRNVVESTTRRFELEFEDGWQGPDMQYLWEIVVAFVRARAGRTVVPMCTNDDDDGQRQHRRKQLMWRMAEMYNDNDTIYLIRKPGSLYSTWYAGYGLCPVLFDGCLIIIKPLTNQRQNGVQLPCLQCIKWLMEREPTVLAITTCTSVTWDLHIVQLIADFACEIHLFKSSHVSVGIVF